MEMKKGEDRYFIGQIARMKRTFTLDDVKKWRFFTRNIHVFYEQERLLEKERGLMVPAILSEGLISEVIGIELPGRPYVLMQKELVFIHPVYINNTITAEVEIIDMNVQRRWITEKVTCMNEDGKDVIKGQIVLKLL